ncbi:MAG: hypothetical protein EA392_13290 [Cryomorphaceae bacterium]|nr:MAG: hypothetical protein EA392_13290 [Cryomorphaceae bacterium]
MGRNVYYMLKDAATRWPEAVAVYDEFGTMTYAGLWAETEALRKWLVEQGVQPGVGLGLICRNSRYFISGLFAAVGTGAVVLPVSHQMKRAEIDEIVAETGLHALLDDQSGVNPHVGDALHYKALPFLDSFRLQFTGAAFSAHMAAHLDDPAFIRFSSGTTGKSKGVVIGHEAVYERVDAANELLALKPGEVVLWVLPMAFHFVVSIVLYVRVGAAVAIARDFLAETVADMCRQTRATLLYASPMHLKLLANHPRELDLSSLRLVISTSTAISPADIERFTTKTGHPVTQAYGIIEIGLPIVNHLNAEQNPEAVGHALPAYRVEILNDHFDVLPADTMGHLAIAGPGMFNGYLKPPSRREEILQKGWFLTGDLAVKTPDGLITVVGRKKSMINVSGNKVFPEEVERVLNSHSHVVESRVFGGRHPLLGEVVEAEVVSREPGLDIEALLKYCRERLSTYKIPQRVYRVEVLEKTATGKLRRR